MKKAFTLIELLIVIAIIGILASMVVLDIKNSTDKAKLANAKRFSQGVRSSVGAYVVGSWTFDDGTAKDVSGNNNNGTIYGATSVDGVMGKALSFDGVDDYVDCGDNASLAITTNFTISLWAKYLGIVGQKNVFIVSKKNIVFSQATGYQVYYSGHNNGTIDMFAGGSYYKRHTVGQDNNWRHYVMVWQGTTLSLYIDGKFINGNYSGTPTPVSTGTDSLWIGKRDQAHIAFSYGIIDDVAIYSEAFTMAQAQELYLAGLSKYQALAQGGN